MHLSHELCKRFLKYLDDDAKHIAIYTMRIHLNKLFQIKCTHKFLLENFSWKFAIEIGSLDLVKFLHYNNKKAYTKRIELGNDQIMYYSSKGITKFNFDLAAAHGHLDIVKFLHYNRTEGCSQLAMTLAANNGHLDIVEFLYTHRKEGFMIEDMQRVLLTTKNQQMKDFIVKNKIINEERNKKRMNSIVNKIKNARYDDFGHEG